MRLLTFYRAAPAGGPKSRPAGFSKARCLASFLDAVERHPPDEVHFVCDGELPPAVLRRMHAFGCVHKLDGAGNTGSFRATLRLALEHGAPDDGVYLVEDDYLHRPESLAVLASALRSADRQAHRYFTLYDHPDRYRRDDDARSRGRTIDLVDDRHWRRVESTTMTFAARVETLRADRWLLELWSAPLFKYPHDRAIWRSLQRLGKYRALPGPSRQLLSVLPAEATHMEVAALAPAVDWSIVMESSTRDAERLGIDTDRW